MQFYPFPFTSSLLGPNIFLSTLFSNTPHQRTAPYYAIPSFTTTQTKRNNGFVYFNYHILRLKENLLWTDWQQAFPESSLLLIFSYKQFRLLMSSPYIWTLTHFQRIATVTCVLVFRIYSRSTSFLDSNNASALFFTYVFNRYIRTDIVNAD